MSTFSSQALRQTSILFLSFGIFSGCWNKEYNEPGRIEIEKKATDLSVSSGFQRTWAATRSIFAKFPIAKKDIDPSTSRAYLVTDWIRGKSDVLYHGFDRNRVPYIIRYKLYVYVTGNGGASNIRIQNVEQYLDDVVTAGVDIQGALQTWVKTDSSTLKENRLLEEIQKLVGDPKFNPTQVAE